MKVRWSVRALAQLEAAHDYIDRENPPSAVEFVVAIEALTSLLSMFPEIGIRTSRTGVRMFPLLRYRYILYYRVQREEVHILRLTHSSRNRR